jgi:hypothetical protein
LDPEEHELYCWREYDLALEMIYWESTRRALTAAETILSLES